MHELLDDSYFVRLSVFALLLREDLLDCKERNRK